MPFSNAQQLKQIFEEVYTDIFKTRFWGLPIANHHLTVQVIGLRETDDFYTFSLVTPWMLNQVAAPKREQVEAGAVEGMRPDQLDRVGDFYVINAISPMDIFVNMEMAIEEGEKLAEQLFTRISDVDYKQPEDKSRREFFQKIIRKTDDSNPNRKNSPWQDD